MKKVAKWSVLTAGIATAALTNFEATHPISHAAWFLAGSLWTLCAVLLVMAFRRHYAEREAMTPEERIRHDDDMSI